MKKSIYLLSAVLMLGSLSACVGIELAERAASQQVRNNLTSTPTLTALSVSESPALPSLEVDTFTFEELRARGIGGCGMSLWKPTSEQIPTTVVFFNQFEAVEPGTLAKGGMWMKIEGKMVKFQRIAASGEEFYGQNLYQVFQNEDKTLRAEVTVELGAKGEIESVAIASGTVRVEREGKVVEIPVVGDAGC